MERVPPQLDLVRLCDAADEVVKFYREPIQRNYGRVQDFTWELDLFNNIVRLLPYPRHYWTPFDIDLWEARARWQGWTDEVYSRFVDVIANARYLYSLWMEAKDGAQPNDLISERRGNVFAGVRKHIELAQFEFENSIDDLKESADLLREKLKSPMPFNLLPDAKSLSLYRDEPNYKHNFARLGAWFPVVSAICTSDSRFLSHDDTEKAFTAAGIKGAYDPSFRVALSRRINDDLKTLGVEIVAVRGKGWKLELFSQTLP